ncbi:GPO family capsid scaffolding protein [Solimicrobium silvestre]|uniref:Phage capsid scaffolding protein (GPO) serine peptidase n=1 Tax=Solimicrobium silvestre TaxID=2099400 RepID=A0A2S9GT18_9BURK|nr:GPO family capsid scaffolding protein [Solimicrobium silvestre]PRC90864.1 Phage capsid scaffolding protein (GPO) serine peptidase [Solimicrobium silvestre]
MPTSKFFRVATEGATTDGRVIDRATITQLAQSFNPKTYGARIWMEHIRGMTADSIFKAYGDVVAVKADEVETDTGKKLALFAQISPTPDLIAMSKARQKIYTSLEINPKFSDTGLPYLVGLGITDSPASLGTDILTFSAQQGENSPFAARKQNPDNFYTEAVEITVEFDDKPTDPDTGKLTTTLKNLFKKITTSDAAQDARFAELSTAIETVAQHVVTELDSYASQLTQIATLEKTITDLHNNFTAFKQLMDTQDSNPDQRPPAIGGPGTILTDC